MEILGDFRADPYYLDRMPDLQNSGNSGIQGSNLPIAQVGISGFRLPIQIKTGDGLRQRVDATFTGAVELEPDFASPFVSAML